MFWNKEGCCWGTKTCGYFHVSAKVLLELKQGESLLLLFKGFLIISLLQ